MQRFRIRLNEIERKSLEKMEDKNENRTDVND